MIICGYQGIGKSTLAGKNNVIDLESGNFWVDPSGVGQGWIRPDCWTQIYVNIAEHLSKQGYKVFMSSHKQVRDELKSRGIHFWTMYPALSLKDEWIEKLRKRHEESKLDKDYKALKNAEQMFEQNIQDLASEELHYEISDINYNLSEELSKLIISVAIKVARKVLES